jgi:septum site-determining protein MinD
VILAVAGGKGGVGTSTVAGALARRLDAVVVETDLAVGRRVAGPTLVDALAGRVAPSDVVRAGREKRIPLCSSLAGARAAGVRRFPPTLRDVEREYDRVVVDCPSGLSSTVGMALLVADAVVLVTVPEEAAVVGGLRVRGLARRLDAGLACVAYNRTREPPDGARRAFGAPVVAIPVDGGLARPGPEASPGETASERFDALAERVQRACNSS